MNRYRLTIALLLFVSLPTHLQKAHSACSSTNNGIAAYYSINWQSKEFPRCSYEDLVEAFEAAAHYHEISSDSTTFCIDEVLTNSPTCNYDTLVEELAAHRTVFIESHGAWQGALISDYYSDEQSRDEAYDAIRSKYNLSEWDLKKHDYGPESGEPQPIVPCIVVSNAAIDVIAARLQPECLLGGFFCYSLLNPGRWNIHSPKTMLGYEYSMDARVNCDNMAHVIKCMGCKCWFTGHQTDDALRGTLVLDQIGNEKNQLRCNSGCGLLAGRFLHASAIGATVRFCYLGERIDTRYVVEVDGAEEAVIGGRGEDGVGVIRCYEASVPAGSLYRVRAEDYFGNLHDSTEFPPSAKSGHWGALESYNGMTFNEMHSAEPVKRPVAEAEPSPAKRLERLREMRLIEDIRDGYVAFVATDVLGGNSNRDDPPGCADCAEVVIVGPSGWQWVSVLNTAMVRIITQWDLDARFFQNIGGWRWTPREILSDVVDANIAHNTQYGTSYPVDPTPLLIIIGDKFLHDYPRFPENSQGSCQADSCFSISLLADINEDGRPDGPHSLIPAGDTNAAYRALDNAFHWNAGIDVRTDGRVVCFLDDENPNVGGEAQIGFFEAVRTIYEESGLSAGPLRKHSETAYADRRQIGISDINLGVRDIWAGGFDLSAFKWTDYLAQYAGQESIEDELMTDQIVCAYGISCWTGDMYHY